MCEPTPNSINNEWTIMTIMDKQSRFHEDISRSVQAHISRGADMAILHPIIPTFVAIVFIIKKRVNPTKLAC